MNKILTIFLLVFMIGLVSAETPHKINTDLTFSITSNKATACTLTTINTPTNVLVLNLNGTKNSQTFTFNIDKGNFSEVGIHQMNIECSDGTTTVTGQITREVSYNGRAKPDGFLVALFSIFYIIFFAGLMYLIVYSIGHFMNLDFDLVDLAYNYGTFFAFLTLFYLSQEYVGNYAIENMMSMFMWPLGLLLLIVPIIMFVISITIGALKPQSMNYGTRRIRRSKL